ncbi:MAG: alpha/beta fold hydrolase [Alphaproteobacteria bacterium]|nr:alpha/beta fold hydrolase [Alphaproteobacteria bacterium]
MNRRQFASLLIGGATVGFSMPARADRELGEAKTQFVTLKDFRLQSGVVLPEVSIAYHAFGTLAADGRNAVLLMHGYTAGHHMIGRAGGAVGSWDVLAGPGKAIDTDRLFVVSSNMLGSCFGSTGPASINPATGKPWGPDFPAITAIDIVTAQRRLLEALGVQHVLAVTGPSYGGMLAFQWGVSFPDFVDAIVPVVAGPKSHDLDAPLKVLSDWLAEDPNWNGGWYYDKGGIAATMADFYVGYLENYGIDAQLRPRFPDEAARKAEIRRRAEAWARVFDGNALLALYRAVVRFDAEKDFARLKGKKVLYVLSRSDHDYPPSIAPGIIAKMRTAGADAAYFEIDSDLGHFASGADGAKWAPRLRAFMDGLDKRR